MSEEKIKFLPHSVEEAVNSESDIFGRDEFAAGLERLFDRSAVPLVALLDEPWGTGKTVFARRFANIAKKSEKLTPIYFDAFINDHEPDPFIALASAILEKFGGPEKSKDLNHNAKQLGRVLLRTGLKSSVRLMTAGVVRASEIGEAKEEIADEISNIVEAEFDHLIDERLRSFSKDQQTLASFRSVLRDYAAKKPLVIIVDELDRCKPTYALLLIESVKHFFSVEGVHFLIVGNSKSLNASIKNEYGGEIDAVSYLMKFIDFRLNFPSADQNAQRISVRSFISQALGDVGNYSENESLRDSLVNFLDKRYNEKKYSLRDIEKICNLSKLIFLSMGKRSLKHPAIIPILVDLKFFAPEMYSRIKRGELRYSDISERYGFGLHINPTAQRVDPIARWWKLLLDQPSGDEWTDFYARLQHFDDKGPEIVALIASQVIDPINLDT